MYFKRRQLVIKTMETKEVEKYYYEFPKLSTVVRENNIKNAKQKLAKMDNDIRSNGMLSVLENDTNKIVGIIRFERTGIRLLKVKVCIPNEAKLFKYGYEVVDQFLKVCKEEWKDIKFVKLDKTDAASHMYMKEQNLDYEYIQVA